MSEGVEIDFAIESETGDVIFILSLLLLLLLLLVVVLVVFVVRHDGHAARLDRAVGGRRNRLCY